MRGKRKRIRRTPGWAVQLGCIAPGLPALQHRQIVGKREGAQGQSAGVDQEQSRERAEPDRARHAAGTTLTTGTRPSRPEASKCQGAAGAAAASVLRIRVEQGGIQDRSMTGRLRITAPFFRNAHRSI